MTSQASPQAVITHQRQTKPMSIETLALLVTIIQGIMLFLSAQPV